jgi:hypothetical protein
MDGRDIGTVVLPDAELKVYLDASRRARSTPARGAGRAGRGRDVGRGARGPGGPRRPRQRARHGAVVKGTVIDIIGDWVMVDVGYKAEGRISAAEFRDEPTATCHRPRRRRSTSTSTRWMRRTASS